MKRQCNFSDSNSIPAELFWGLNLHRATDPEVQHPNRQRQISEIVMRNPTSKGKHHGGYKECIEIYYGG